MTRITIIAALLVIAAGSAGAQADPDSIHQRNDCRLATQTLQAGHPGPKTEWALSLIRSCGPAGGQALAAAVRATRAATDSALLEYMRYQTGNFRDAAVFDALLEVAGDRGAGDRARIYALLALADLLHPNEHYSYADATTGIDADGSPRCARMSRWMSGTSQVNGTPLPTDYRARAGAVRNAIWNDTSGSRLVRAAAACLF